MDKENQVYKKQLKAASFFMSKHHRLLLLPVLN